MNPLSPPLPVVEENLFGPSEDLQLRLASGDPSVPLQLRAAVMDDPRAAERIHKLAESKSETRADEYEDAPTAGGEATVLAQLARDLMERRAAVLRRGFKLGPQSGQIVSIEHVIGPAGDIGTDLARPMVALLDEATDTRDVWHGWMVGAETDYATCWDVLLEPEDEPFDPLAAMVQIWNPVYIYLPSVARVLGELKPARVQAMRALAEELLWGNKPNLAQARPGKLVARVLDQGLTILSGTPLSSPEDPRWRYQEIYHAAAEAFRLPAWLAQQDILEPQPSLLDRWLDAVRSRFALITGRAPEARTSPVVLQKATQEPQPYRGPGGSRTRMAYGFGLAVIVLQAIALSYMAIERPDNYTDIRSKVAAPAIGPLIRVSFRPDAKESDVRFLLVGIGASIVGGPSQLGDYYLYLEAPRVDWAAQQLRQSPIVDNVNVVATMPPAKE